MRRVFARAIVVLVAGITTSQAADMPVKARPLPAAVAAFNWSGFYVGGNAGWSSRNADLDPVDPTVTIQQVSNVTVPGRGLVVVPGTTRLRTSTNADVSDFIGGGQIGYNVQFNQWVYGLEADAQRPSGSRTGTFTTLLPFTALTQPSPITIARKFDADLMASLRVRAGFTVLDRALIYGTGGVAAVRGTVTSTDTFAIAPGPGAPPINSDIGPIVGYPSTTGTAKDSQTHVGWTLGAGGDWALTDNFIVGILYRHSDFGSATYQSGTNTLTPGLVGFIRPGLSTSSDRVRITDDQVTGRVSWLFGPR